MANDVFDKLNAFIISHMMVSLWGLYGRHRAAYLYMHNLT
jgi:hypothetical protein